MPRSGPAPDRAPPRGDPVLFQQGQGFTALWSSADCGRFGLAHDNSLINRKMGQEMALLSDGQGKREGLWKWKRICWLIVATLLGACSPAPDFTDGAGKKVSLRGSRWQTAAGQLLPAPGAPPACGRCPGNIASRKARSG